MMLNDIYARLESFNPENLNEAAYERLVLSLLQADLGYGSAAAAHAGFLSRPALGRPLPSDAAESLSHVDRRIADDCLEHIFSFKGARHPMGADIDWNNNPGFDHWIHDLNRFNFIPILVNATRESGDEAYVRKAAFLILDWVDKNPVTDSWHWREGWSATDSPMGPWKSYLNIAIHLRHWAEAFDDLKRYWSPMELLRVLKSIHDQCGYLVDIIPTHSNNWVTIGCTGLLNTLGRLPELRIAPAGLTFAGDLIVKSAATQVLDDGVQFELTQGYHVLVARLLLNALECEALPGVKLDPSARALANRMLDYAMQMILPSGDNVAFNDTDPEATDNWRSLLATEGRRIGRSDWVYVGTQGAEGDPPQARSQAFENAGVYVMRTGWTRNDACLVFDGGPWGAAHQHDDRLSFQFAALGRTFIVDPGRYLYDKNNPYSRDQYLALSRAHSTITVDDESQADWWFKNQWVPGPKLTQNHWRDDGDVQRVTSVHTLGYGKDGYVRVTHRRSVIFWQPDVVLVMDELVEGSDSSIDVTVEGTGAGDDSAASAIIRHVESRLQFYPGDVVHDAQTGVWHTCYDDANLAVMPFLSVDFRADVETGLLNPTRGWYSPEVNQIVPSPTLRVHTRATLPLRSGFVLTPYVGASRPRMSVRMHGRSVSVQVNGRDLTANFDDAAN